MLLSSLIVCSSLEASVGDYLAVESGFTAGKDHCGGDIL